ncbi:MAG TPA: bifunctional oligoribonuclease/PAP phosphatase NrnA [Anaerolineae bacterium]|nr:bifunctional oligoribonuclease/PAP phosphatase NrnA [Anaerolineae bacterium]
MNLPSTDTAALLDQIGRAASFLLITHISPDSDAIGSLLGLTHALRGLGKIVTPACSDPLRGRFDLLPGDADVVTSASGPSHQEKGIVPYDLVIALDCGDEGRMGSVWSELPAPRPPLINLDHHVTNTRFGQINWVDPSATSTAEIVLEAIDLLGAPLTSDIARCLLHGLVGDTLGFRTPNTTPTQLHIAQRLMEAGASLNLSMDYQFNRRSLALICLWGKAISALKIKDRIIYTAISKAMRHACGMSGSGDISLSSFLISANEADRAAVLVEKDDGQVEISLRARPGFNVSNAAKALGGGGHPLAAGATIDGPLTAATHRVIVALKANA